MPPGSTYCTSHDPNRKAQRQKIAAKAGRSKPTAELNQIKARIKQLCEDVLEGEVDKSKASVSIQGYGVLKGYLELERRLREAEELEQRIEQLEAMLSHREKRYG